MGKKLSKPGDDSSVSPTKSEQGNSETDTTRSMNNEENEEDVGPLEDYDIDDQFSKSNDKPLTIDDFELLKVYFMLKFFH